MRSCQQGRGASQLSERDQIVFFNRLDVYYKAPDSGERHPNQGPEKGDLVLLCGLVASGAFQLQGYLAPKKTPAHGTPP